MRLLLCAPVLGLASGPIGCGFVELVRPAPIEGTGGAGGAIADGGGGEGGTAGGGEGAGGEGDGGSVSFDCAAGSLDGPASGAENEVTPRGHRYHVRMPPDYDATRAHPLIVVYSGAGVTEPSVTENHTGLTGPATARGYIVAYVNHVGANANEEIFDVATIPELMAARWCIDERRIYMTGHSDGGTVSTKIGVYSLARPTVTAIAPSAAGIGQTMFLDLVGCPPQPLPVMVLHSANDTLFPPPEFGSAAATWWADCASCDGVGSTAPDGCQIYDGCAPGSEVQYCEGNLGHGGWLPLKRLDAELLRALQRTAVTVRRAARHKPASWPIRGG